MRKSTYFVLLVAAFLALGLAKGVKKSSEKRPNKTSPELYCNACQAIVREALKELKHRKSETDVMATMIEICDPKKYMIYGNAALLLS